MGDDVGGTPDVSHPRAPPRCRRCLPCARAWAWVLRRRTPTLASSATCSRRRRAATPPKMMHQEPPLSRPVIVPMSLMCYKAERAQNSLLPSPPCSCLASLLPPPLRPSPITPAEKKQSKPRSEPTGRTLGVECGREQERALPPSVALPPSLCHPLLWTSSSCSKCTSPPPPAPLSLLDSCLPSALRHALSSPCFPRASVPRSRRRRIALEHKRTQGRKVIIFRAQRQEK